MVGKKTGRKLAKDDDADDFQTVLDKELSPIPHKPILQKAVEGTMRKS